VISPREATGCTIQGLRQGSYTLAFSRLYPSKPVAEQVNIYLLRYFGMWATSSYFSLPGFFFLGSPVVLWFVFLFDFTFLFDATADEVVSTRLSAAAFSFEPIVPQVAFSIACTS